MLFCFIDSSTLFSFTQTDGIEAPPEGYLSPPLATSSPIRPYVPPAAPRKAAAPLWRPWALVGLRPLPDLERAECELEEEERRRKRLEAEEAIYAEWEVRPKFLRWTPGVIAELEDAEELYNLHQRFAFPASQPRNADETIFCAMVAESIVRRMAELRLQRP